MSDAAGARAISAVTNGKVRELPHARTFAVESSGGDDVYLVTLATLPGRPVPPAASCTCEAGRRGRSCWHVRAAHLMARDDSPQMRRARGLEPVRPARRRERA